MTFWQFWRKRWRRLTLIAVGWTLTVFFVLPRLPAWVSLIVYAAVFGWTCYTWGEQTERKRRIRDTEAHAQEFEAVRELLEAKFGRFAQLHIEPPRAKTPEHAAKELN